MADEVLRKGRKPHVCYQPGTDEIDGDGAVWRCECGQRWLWRVTNLQDERAYGSWSRLSSTAWHCWWRWLR